jgi:hypothetical protein
MSVQFLEYGVLGVLCLVLVMVATALRTAWTRLCDDRTGYLTIWLTRQVEFMDALQKQSVIIGQALNQSVSDTRELKEQIGILVHFRDHHPAVDAKRGLRSLCLFAREYAKHNGAPADLIVHLDEAIHTLDENQSPNETAKTNPNRL